MGLMVFAKKVCSQLTNYRLHRHGASSPSSLLALWRWDRQVIPKRL